MSESRPRLYLIDGYSSIFRAFYAIRGLSNSEGRPTNAVYGFVTMLRKLLREESPELIGVALDVSGPTVRKEQYEEYKANRTPMPDDLKVQMPYIRRAIEAYRIPILELESYEADDVLGTLANRAVAAGYDVVLVSADKDLMQLVGPHVSLLHTGRDKVYDAAAVEEDFGVPPERVTDVLALVGDSVDNVPGVPGIGAKGAVSLIRDFGSLDELLARAGEVSRKSYREGLEEHRDKAELSKELVTIHVDLPIEFESEALHLESPDTDSLRELFSELEFHSLVEELEGEGASQAFELSEAEALANAQELKRRAGELQDDVMIVPLWSGELLGVALGDAAGTTLVADLRANGMRDAMTGLVDGWTADPERTLVGHDLKEVLRLGSSPARVRAALFDTMIAGFLGRASQRALALEEAALERLQYSCSSAKELLAADDGQLFPGRDALPRFAGERLEVLRRIVPLIETELGDGADRRVYDEIEEPLIPVLLDMEEAGIGLDVAFLGEMSADLGRAIEAIEGEIYREAGEEFNINSPKQLGELMFERLGYPAVKKTRKTKSYSTSAETLQTLATQGYALPGLVLQFREMTKLKSTYVDALPSLVAADGRLHTRYNQVGAATGRLSSYNPNLQNIPIRTEQGQQIRKAFRAAPGMSLVVADYSQIELRVLAHIAQEEALIAAFHAGADIHQSTAAKVFGVAPELVSGDQRRAAKVINFGILYGMSAFGLAQNLGISTGEADTFIKTYLSRYPKVEAYMAETLEAAKTTGKVQTLYGRARWLPDINSRNWNLRENARRMAINARIQGTAADLLKKAMVELAAALREELPAARLLLTVHDELVLEVPTERVDAASELARREMTGVAHLDVPLVVDLGAGQTWYDAKA